jgi:hypothetical protein
MLNKFSTQLVRIFSGAQAASVVPFEDDAERTEFEFMTDAEFDRRVARHERDRAELREIHEAHRRWQDAVDEAHRLRLEYILVFGRRFPEVLSGHDGHPR